MKGNVFYKDRFFAGVTVQSIGKYMVSFDLQKDDFALKGCIEFLTKDENTSMTFYKDSVSVILPRQDIEIVWW